MKKNFMISAAMLLVGAVMAFAQPQAGKNANRVLLLNREQNFPQI